MDLIVWADHAFNLYPREWALEAYARLSEDTGTSRGFRRLAESKEGFCWLDIAVGHRREAMLKIRSLEQWNECLNAANQAIEMSLLHIGDFQQLGEHLVVHYNKACSWGLSAQYAVEQAVTWNTEWLAGRAERLSSNCPRGFRSTKGYLSSGHCPRADYRT
ncbi:hypothetical protein [Paludisphaera mucosa]|uniref:Uncharacterized protein n=1 Tax=Paludisphaera mucosa TaxID=3030827 RepID=A0ABT6FM48_9BACT|nr:hypothetical protein [Paludisphaera mucosa]MDG3008455.1 hypothetical protein [Paludisphaera mucosa]